jgi:hypothetical protein
VCHVRGHVRCIVRRFIVLINDITNIAGTTTAGNAAATAIDAASTAVALEYDSGYSTDDSQASGSVRTIDSEHDSSSSGCNNTRSNVLLVGSDMIIETLQQRRDDQHSSSTPTPSTTASNANTTTAASATSVSDINAAVEPSQSVTNTLKVSLCTHCCYIHDTTCTVSTACVPLV